MTTTEGGLPDPNSQETLPKETPESSGVAEKASGKRCPQCGATVPPGMPSVLCPKCLLTLGFESQPGVNQPSTAAYRPRFVAPLPEQLAPYFPQLEILERVGYGGMGVVYKARQKELDRTVALKILRPDFENDPGFAERFQREARALAKLNHPHIVTVYDFGKQGDLYFFLMEFVDGTNLRHVEQTGRLSCKEALGIVPQVCDALQYAHEQGVVHRDIKPENILISKEGCVKIADFGLAKIARSNDELGNVDESGKQLTGTREVIGTPHYMAPEQVEHPTEVDHRADIFSLGVVLYEMLTGELPLGRFPLPSQKVRIDLRLDEVVLRALEKEPSQRYQRITDVRTDVNHIRDSEALPPDTSQQSHASGHNQAAGQSKFKDRFTAWVKHQFSPSMPFEPKTREQLERELSIPAAALISTGVISFLIGLFMFFTLPFYASSVSATFVFLSAMSLGAGALSTVTGLRLKSLQSYLNAVVGCIVLPTIFGVLWFVSLPFAIWALIILKHPNARGHFTDVPFVESYSWLTIHDTTVRLGQRCRALAQFVWPKICVALSQIVVFARRAFQKFVAFFRSKIVISSAIFLGLAYVWTAWIAGIQIAMVVAEGSIRPGIVRGGFELSQFDPTQVPLPLMMTGVCLILGWIVLWRHSVRVFRSSGSLSRADRLAAPREALLGLAGTSFLTVVVLTIVSVISRMPSRPPGLWRWGLENWDWRFLLLMVQLGFDLLIGLSLTLLRWTSRTRLTRWALFVSTIAYPLLLGTILLERTTRGYWTPLVPIWSCVPFGLWAIIALRKEVKQSEPTRTLPEEGIATAAST